MRPTTTLWRLTEIKVEFLMQLFPPMIFGLYWPRFSKWAAMAGLLAGSSVVAAMTLAGLARWWYFQAGIYGFAINVAICVALGALIRPGPPEQKRIDEKFFRPFATLP